MIIVFVKKASNGDLNLLLSLEGDRRQEGKEGRGGEERRGGRGRVKIQQPLGVTLR